MEGVLRACVGRIDYLRPVVRVQSEHNQCWPTVSSEEEELEGVSNQN